MAAALAADSTEVASGGITQAGAELASTAVGAVMAGAGTAGVTQAGELESASALVGAGVGAGVPTGRVTRMPMAIRTITPTFHITHTMARPGMRRRTRIGITVAAEIRVTIRSGRIRTIASRKDRLAQTTRHR